MHNWKPLPDADYWGAYSVLLDSFGYETLVQVDDEAYQGDSRILFRDGDRHGVLIFGWGSCSGCDALQACESKAEAEELRRDLHESIHWEESRDGIWDWLCGRDWIGQYSWHADETKQFLAECLRLLPPPPLSEQSRQIASVAAEWTDARVLSDSLREDGLRWIPDGLQSLVAWVQVLERVQRFGLRMEPLVAAESD